MKISINDQELFTLSDTQKKVIQNDVLSEIFEEDMKRRIKWVLLEEKYTQSMLALRREWEPRLKQKGYKVLPTDDDEFAKIVFSQPDYMNRSQRERTSQ